MCKKKFGRTANIKHLYLIKNFLIPCILPYNHRFSCVFFKVFALKNYRLKNGL